ncbi:tetratricopeptide repeat protein [Kitasatospora aureofaciens]|uniref:tetratricopeptide repeat protein n=1 Tax=Kitasatospora aureofaciens TaxID=1894 RepID=UPI00210D9FAE|nr:tetratricopeptide repeat protein [Kitasatospora aureofaciens]
MTVTSTTAPDGAHTAACGRRIRERTLGQAGSPEPVPHDLVELIAKEIEAHCGHRPLKAHRMAMGWTVAEAVQAAHDLVDRENLRKVGLTERFWKDWEAGKAPSAEYQDLLCRLLCTGPVQLGLAADYTPVPTCADSPDSATLPAGPADAGAGLEEVAATKRRTALMLTGLAIAAPATAAQVLDQAAAEALEFTRQGEASSLGAGTLDHLDLAVTDFNDAYSLKPPRQVFAEALDYRRKVDALLKARHTHEQGRELLAYAGWLSELLAWLAHDLGSSRAGLAFANDAFVHGQQAGHGELCAWAMDAAASINLYEHRADRALNAARRGLTQAPATHPLTVRLHAQAARAAAADGDSEGFTASLRAAEDAHKFLPVRMAHRFGLDPLPLADYALTSYPATACIWLGQAENARRHAEHALQVYEAAPAASRSPSREAIARIDLALAHAQLGAPDDAVALGAEALDSDRVVDSVRNRANDLTTYLARRYPGHGAAGELRERLTTLSIPA